MMVTSYGALSVVLYYIMQGVCDETQLKMIRCVAPLPQLSSAVPIPTWFKVRKILGRALRTAWRFLYAMTFTKLP